MARLRDVRLAPAVVVRSDSSLRRPVVRFFFAAFAAPFRSVFDGAAVRAAALPRFSVTNFFGGLAAFAVRLREGFALWGDALAADVVEVLLGAIRNSFRARRPAHREPGFVGQGVVR